MLSAKSQCLSIKEIVILIIKIKIIVKTIPAIIKPNGLLEAKSIFLFLLDCIPTNADNALKIYLFNLLLFIKNLFSKYNTVFFTIL